MRERLKALKNRLQPKKSTCFIFVNEPDAHVWLSIRFDVDGKEEVGLALRSAEDISLLQKNAITWIVLTHHVSRIFLLELGRLSQRKAAVVIPFLLEERLAQPIEALHFSFRYSRIDSPHYCVAVIEKAVLTGIMDHLTACGIVFDGMTLDWFALQPGERCVTRDTMLVFDTAFQGSLPPALVESYIQQHPVVTEPLAFTDSFAVSFPVQKIEQSCLTWVAQRLCSQQLALRLNLCHGEMRVPLKYTIDLNQYRMMLLFIIAWLGSVIISNAALSVSLSQRLVRTEQEIATIYRSFFPQATHISDPQTQVMHLIQQQNTEQRMVLWTLFDALSKALLPDIHLQKGYFHERSLIVTVECKSFMALAQMQKGLRQRLRNVKQIQAFSENQRVIAVLELQV